MTMSSYGLCCALVVLIVQTCAVYGQEEIIKSSLTFIIDDTASMPGEIRQVKEEIDIIFEKMSSSNTSQIENFVLVTFNDPLAQVRIITKDRNEFKRALAAIRVHGGGDPPEYAMKGIELGLTESLPLSYLYVFTDDSAKDYSRFEAIKSISQRKQSQVVFMLTGKFDSRRDAKYKVYHKVADATGGQVFHMMKDDVTDVLKYIEESVTGRSIMLYNKKLPRGDKKIPFYVDSHMGELLISITGKEPWIGEVIGPGGSKPTMEPVVSDKSEIVIVKVINAKPGYHEMEVGSSSDTHVVITAKSDINFQLGFSIDRPDSMKDTVTRPAPFGYSFLGIRLLGKGVKLTAAKILNLRGTVVTELPLELVDEISQFYVTPSFNAPFTMFRVSVIGKDLQSETPIERTSPIPLSRQDFKEKKENTAPVITIQGGPKIITEYDAPLKLKCNVHGYPPPDIIWEEKDTGHRMPAKVQLVDVPYDYVSTLQYKSNKNITYQCKASNIVGTAIKYVEVEIEIYFDIIEAPKDIRVEYNKEGTLVCKVDAYPPASLTWYKDEAVFSGNDYIDISSDKSMLTIKHMQPESQGNYTCEGRNDFNRTVSIAEVVIFGVEKPVIDKLHEEIRVTEKTNAALSCRILEGIPKPTVTWSFRPAGMDAFRVMKETTETVHLNNVRKDQTGSYKCKAKNYLGSDRFTMELVVEYPPKIKDDVKLIQIKADDEVRISCDVTGEPSPVVTWFFNGTRLDNTAKTRVSSDNSLRFKARLADTGSYRCEAVNKLGLENKTTFLDVLEKPVIDKSHEEIRVTEKTNAALSCRILEGVPKPTVTWSFRPAGMDAFIVMKETTETVHLNNVRKDQTGSYKCNAKNFLGSDRFTMELVVEYPPKIKEDVKLIQIKADDEVRISCDVTGEPSPVVTWFFNGTRLDNTATTRVSSDNSLRFKAMLVDTGSYRCEAVNKLGLEKKTTFLQVFVPVTIETPKKSTIEVMVGKSTILYCRADGHPKPNIKWTFQSIDRKIPVKDITPTGGVGSVVLKRMQLYQQGLYTCEVENGIGGSASITYDVKVYASPLIENVYLSKSFEAVEGDSLRIQCKTTGSPKPTIYWMKNGLHLAIGSEWYEMEDDGTLIIKNIDRDSKGTYVCLAENMFGNDTEAYEVIVRDNLVPSNTVFVEEGKTIDIKCDVPHTSTDQMRWFKDGVAISSEELTLYSVTRIDDGLYTCRVSNPTKSRSVTTKVVIGFKPIFTTKEEETVELSPGSYLKILSCEAYGKPKPMSAVWKHNGKELNTTAMSHPLAMEYDAIGTYECEVSNEFGSIHRTFKVTSRDCILNIQKDFPVKQPIMYSTLPLRWPVFPVNDGYMIIPHADYFFFNCPSLFSDSNLPPQSNLIAFCERDSTIKIHGKTYNFADIQCNEEVKPQVSKTGNPCLPGNTEHIKIGYRLFHKFLEVYDVCLDKENNVPLFTMHKLSPDHTDKSTEAGWSNSFLPQDFDTLYDCSRQMYNISTLGRGLRTHESCCFGKRQLVNSHNLLPGIPTSSVYDYINVIPHWSTCNSKNWEDVEQSVRNLVKLAGRDLIITTGTHHTGPSTDMTLHDGYGGKQSVAPYLWKLVQDPAQSASLAIIHVNIPELSPEEASKYVLCPDICVPEDPKIIWIDPSNWHNVEDGYTYCCTITEFEKAFGYNGRFNSYMARVLFDGNLELNFDSAKK